MKQIIGFLLIPACVFVMPVSAQKIYNEGTVTYNIVVSTGNAETKAADLLDGAVMRMYVKGMQTRTDLKSILGTTITLQDARSGAAVVLNEYGDQKIMIRMSKDEFEDRNRKFNGLRYELKNDTKTILGYTCKLAVVTLADGTTFRVYYAPDLVFQNKNYGQQFQTLPGFPLEYESELGKMKVTYIADKIAFDPITASLFDIPKTGYREMTYEEVKKTQSRN
jgi:GLPGLI family protein